MARVMSKAKERASVSPKVTVASLGASISAIIWILLPTFNGKIDRMEEAALTAVTGATATLLAFLLGYFVRDPERKQ